MNTEELLNKKGVVYRYSGADLLVHCLNPEHADSHPSMRIDKGSGKFHCLSCGYSGNIFSYYNEARNMVDVRSMALRDKINKLMQPTITIPITASYFARDYRGISKDTYKHFKAFTLDGDKLWDGRLVFPITDVSGEIIAFQGRNLFTELEPKYLVQPRNVELPLFPATVKSEQNSIILVEGLFDMLNLYDKGLRNTVCAFGVSLVSKSDRNNAKLKKRFSKYKIAGINKIYVMFDGDKAGRAGAIKLKEALKDSYIVEIIELEEGSDPGSLTKDDVESIREYLYGKSSDS